MNMRFLAASENIKVSDGTPAEYIPALVGKLGDSAKKVFDRNLLPNPLAFDYVSGSWE